MGPGLRGRHRECEALDGLIDAVRRGSSQVLVLEGEAGIGKTALLDHVRDQATGCRVLRTAGIESEAELAFAGLHQLCAPIIDRIDRLPDPQRIALGTAFGLVSGDAPDTFFVGLAVLGLLSDTAEEQPLLCLVDDVQWLDQASARALAFVARRLLAESVGVVFAQRSPAAGPELDGLPVLAVAGLPHEDAAALLEAAVPGRIDPQVRERVITETDGNPLALVELTRGRTAQDVAGGFAVPAAGPLTSRIELSFEQRVRALPADGQTLIRLAAAEPVGDVPLLWRAAAILGLDDDAAASVESAGLLEIGSRVRFAHPLVRSVTYRAATPAERRAVHAALAEATDVLIDPDRRAWHRGQAAMTPDEEVAADLVRAAATASQRGGAAATAAFLTRATELTPDLAQRTARALEAAVAQLDAAAPREAATLVAVAERGPLDDLQQATAVHLRARIAFAERRGGRALPLLLDAARRLEPLDSARARHAQLETLGAAIFAGRMALDPTLPEVAAQARASGSGGDGVVDLLVDGLAARFTDGYADAVAPLRRVLDRLSADGDADDALPWLWMGCRIASDLWADDALELLTDRQVRLARSRGALNVLSLALALRAGVLVHGGDFAGATALLDESLGLTRSIGGAQNQYSAIVLSAWRGDDGSLREIDTGIETVTAIGEGRSLSWGEYARALYFNGTGAYPEALEAATSAAAHDDLGIAGWALFELVEAAVRSDRPDLAAEAVEQIRTRAAASGTPWARGVDARSRALLAEAAAAEELYRSAIEHLAETRVAVHLARTHLVFGEWLRRENRRVDAREHLRTAHEMFSAFGAEGFAERSRRELLATGETARRRTVADVDVLTPQETQIARLARDGHTNPEIGSQLFISPRTVEYHLRKVFTKLDITSRRELRRALLDPA